MRIATFVAAAAVAAFAGSAFAQETGAVDAGAHWTTPQEQQFYEEEGTLLGGFFVDETYAELRTAEEIETAWAGMPAEDQARLQAACERVEETRGDFGDVTIGLCSQLGEFTN